LKCIDFYPTVSDHRRRFLDLGWTSSHIQTIEQIVRTYFGPSERDRIRTKVDDPFDEAEELQLKCSHYVLIVGEKLNVGKGEQHQLYQISNKREGWY